MKTIKSILFRILSTPLPFPVPHYGSWLHGWRLFPYIRPYEPETVAFLKNYITKDMVVADVGANVGFYTLLFSRYAMKVIAYEPETTSFKRLQRSTSTLPNVRIYKQAVGTPGQATIYGTPGSGTNSLIKTHRKPLETMEVVALDQDIDFAKIDVEGYELEVLRNMKKKVPCVVEYAPDHMPDDYLSEIDTLGYNAYKIGEGGELLGLDTLPTTGDCNLFLEPR